MHKIFMIVLAFLSNVVMAEWTEIGMDGEKTMYIDTASIQIDPGHLYQIKMWSLIDYKVAQKNKTENNRFLSTKYQYEYDCKEEKLIRLVAFSAFSGNMAKGHMLANTSLPLEWELVKPKSMGETAYNLICIEALGLNIKKP